MPSPRRTVPALCALFLAGCTSHAVALPQPSVTPTKAAPPASAPSSAPPTAAARLAVPPATPGEISRVVFSANPDTTQHVIRKVARAGRQYTMVAACVSSPPGEIIEYEILSSKPKSNSRVAGGALTCNDGPAAVSMPLPGTAIQITLGPDMRGVTSAYALIKPAALS
jgi:hypothetical protein